MTPNSPNNKVLGLACTTCKLVISKYFQAGTELNFKYCPNCGQAATALYSYNDITDYDRAFFFGFNIDLYRHFRAQYQTYINEHNGYSGMTFSRFVEKTMQELAKSIQAMRPTNPSHDRTVIL